MENIFQLIVGVVLGIVSVSNVWFFIYNLRNHSEEPGEKRKNDDSYSHRYETRELQERIDDNQLEILKLRTIVDALSRNRNQQASEIESLRQQLELIHGSTDTSETSQPLSELLEARGMTVKSGHK